MAPAASSPGPPALARWATRIAAATTMLAALALIVAGCATPGSGIQAGEHVTIYVSMPLRGPEAVEGRDVVGGAKLALADAGGKVGELAVRAVYLDDTAGRGARARWSPAVAAANARQASEDSTAIAYLGDFDSGASRFSLPITNEARMLQVSPASGAVDLVQPFLGAGDEVPEDVQPTGERTFGRVIPSDAVQAEAAAVWAKRLGARSVGALSDGSRVRRHDGHGVPPGRDRPAPHRTAPGGPPLLRRHRRRRSPAGQARRLPVLAADADRLRRDVRSSPLPPDSHRGLQLSRGPGRRGRTARRPRHLCRRRTPRSCRPPASGSCGPSARATGASPAATRPTATRRWPWCSIRSAAPGTRGTTATRSSTPSSTRRIATRCWAPTRSTTWATRP